ncbi:thiamine phosphate synthase [Pseudooceanicola sp.]|uniref:thiamine phosphate synthase n=1 Tax=Pseudooceanicola sp. TaxID=1914328 RepID=UPI0026285403|nr:thiamine phosphate synthase [Pseudooceanicola sp.]MDF1855761.1 thiamine phosphate synthase [Pseudooceanicola sp.]
MSDANTDAETPQLYLITPAEFDLSAFPDQLAAILDSTEIACVRLALASHDEDRINRAADALREITHARDVALVINNHFVLAERLGLDGVHLCDGTRNVRKARKALGPDAIVGSFCSTSRHDGMSAGEAGADYIAFGPVTAGALGNAEAAEDELFSWWSEMIELPVVAEGGLDLAAIARLAPLTDFFGIGDEIWTAEDPQSALKTLLAPLS